MKYILTLLAIMFCLQSFGQRDTIINGQPIVIFPGNGKISGTVAELRSKHIIAADTSGFKRHREKQDSAFKLQANKFFKGRKSDHDLEIEVRKKKMNEVQRVEAIKQFKKDN